MPTLPKVDVVFVGFGMVGGIIANELSKRATNLKMVGLERGPFRKTNPDFLMDHFDEWRYAVQGQLFQDVSRETWTFRNESAAERAAGPSSSEPGGPAMGWAARWCTGTGSCGAFSPHFFEYRSHLEQRYGKGFLPEDTTIQDWGITYDELEPYYTQFDKTFGIAGKAGMSRAQIQPGGNPFEGAAFRGVPAAPERDRVWANTVQSGMRGNSASSRSRSQPATARGPTAIRTARCSRRAITAGSASDSAAMSAPRPARSLL